MARTEAVIIGEVSDIKEKAQALLWKYRKGVAWVLYHQVKCFNRKGRGNKSPSPRKKKFIQN